jgi:sugar-specific transcriptional regulator TrmB
VKVEEWFGVNAGKVWKTLKRWGEQTARDLAGRTGLTVQEVYGALGWLAREGKISLREVGRRFKFRLTE